MDSIRILSGGVRRVVLVLAVIAGLCAAELPVRAQECIDEEAAARLSVKRKRRGRVPRVFVKAQRHELSLLGGWFVSDLF